MVIFVCAIYHFHLTLLSFSTDKHILEVIFHKYRQPWMALKMLSGGFQNVQRATLSTLRYARLEMDINKM